MATTKVQMTFPERFNPEAPNGGYEEVEGQWDFWVFKGRVTHAACDGASVWSKGCPEYMKTAAIAKAAEKA